jgi:Transposase DDE domain
MIQIIDSQNNQLNNSLISTKNFDLVKCFCIVDDFFRYFNTAKCGRKSILCTSELVTIWLIGKVYEVSCLKRLYELVSDRFSGDFRLPSYKNFVMGMNQSSVYMLVFVQSVLGLTKSTNGDICFIDGTKLEVCKIYREGKHKTMRLLARKSKSTTGWYYGLKLHLLCDKNGNLIRIKFTTATVDERLPLQEFMESMTESVFVGDAGYVSSELEIQANKNRNILLTAKRKNMKTLATIWNNKVMNMRSRIETVFDVLKERYNLVTSLPRSISGYLAHYIRTIFAYMILN